MSDKEIPKFIGEFQYPDETHRGRCYSTEMMDKIIKDYENDLLDQQVLTLVDGS